MGLVDGGGRLLERLEPVLRPDTRWLLLGPARSGTAIHKDPRNTAAWNTVCSGVKRWALLSPEVSAPLAERESPPEGTKWTIPDWFREEWPSIAAEAVEKGEDIPFLKHTSRILRLIESQHCLSVRVVGVASPPVQCSNTGLKMRNKKCEVLMNLSKV